MQAQQPRGWEQILSRADAFRGHGRFPIPAYSEFMPGPHVGLKPYGAIDPTVAPAGDPYGFGISEYEEAHQLRPGLVRIARHLIGELRKLSSGQHAFSKALLSDNPYFPANLVARAPSLAHGAARHSLILSLALSRTQDDKGRVRWTLFGASEQGPARPFWRSFRTTPEQEVSAAEGLTGLRRILLPVMGSDTPAEVTAQTSAETSAETSADPGDLHRAGLRVMPVDRDPDFPTWSDEGLPSFVLPLLLHDDEPLDGVRYLLTFRPFARLPGPVQDAYLDGRIQLLPSPASLLFFGHPGYRKLARRLPLAMQIPLLHLFPGRHAAPQGMRIPQSGWLEEPTAHGTRPPTVHTHGPIVSSIKRTSRWNRTHRSDDETLVLPNEESVAHVLFSNDAEQIGLYGKPMARNAQLWTADHQLILDGPEQGRQSIDEAARALQNGGHYGYRFQFPPMHAGPHDLYWHRPLVACAGPAPAGDPRPEPPDPVVLFDGLCGPGGYVTAYHRGAGAHTVAAPVELWPRPLRREAHLLNVEAFQRDPGLHTFTTCHNVRKLLEAHDRLGEGPLRRSLARALLTVPRHESLDQWLDSLPGRAADPAQGQRIKEILATHIQAAALVPPSDSAQHGGAPFKDAWDVRPGTALTFAGTSRRDFEERYWSQIAELAEGRFVHKDNADQAGENLPAGRLQERRDLEALGDHLHLRHHELIRRHEMEGKALVADHLFRWRTDFDFPWMDGWARNQLGKAHERNIVIIIPGNNRAEAVIMADHYDTAYMEDVYEVARGGDLTRRAAAGADDNHSATAALLMAADVLLPLSQAGKLARDVWLIHLTGEEFPADCLGARHLAQRLVEGNLAVEADGVGWTDLSRTRVRGAYILDMVAHNNDHERYVFQIAPGEGQAAMRLAQQVHLATERWNHAAPVWNLHPQRRTPGPAQRIDSGAQPPGVVAHPLMSGEVRPGWHYRSSLYNTDAQIFSDAGIPVVLLMENYDINRTGYHDTQDTMKNIDLDYGAALAAIAIESVTQVATAEEP